ncbi:hypothetical protein BDV18DRAFT_158726 [Aspergillus unguis]
MPTQADGTSSVSLSPSPHESEVFEEDEEESQHQAENHQQHNQHNNRHSTATTTSRTRTSATTRTRPPRQRPMFTSPFAAVAHEPWDSLFGPQWLAGDNAPSPFSSTRNRTRSRNRTGLSDLLARPGSVTTRGDADSMHSFEPAPREMLFDGVREESWLQRYRRLQGVSARGNRDRNGNGGVNGSGSANGNGNGNEAGVEGFEYHGDSEEDEEDEDSDEVEEEEEDVHMETECWRRDERNGTRPALRFR